MKNKQIGSFVKDGKKLKRIEKKNLTLKCLKWNYSTVRSIKNVVVLTEDRAFALVSFPPWGI